MKPLKDELQQDFRISLVCVEFLKKGILNILITNITRKTVSYLECYTLTKVVSV